MITDTELRGLLTSAAGGPADGPDGWDDVVGRGRHRRRIRRAQAAVVAVLVAGVGVAALSLSNDDPTVETVPPATGPTATTPREGPAATSRSNRTPLVQLGGARAQGAFLTVPLIWSEYPNRGFDPCTALLLRVVESPEEVGIELVGDGVDGGLSWADCHSGGFSSAWGTIELEDAVGARPVVDLTTGRELTVVEGASLLFPDELPEQFAAERRDEWGGRLVDEDGVHTDHWTWTFAWRTAQMVEELRVTTSEAASPSECARDGEEEEDIAVRGTTGRLCRGVAVTGVGGSSGVLYELRWEEGGRWITVLYLSSDPAPLTLDDVLAVAEGLDRFRG